MPPKQKGKPAKKKGVKDAPVKLDDKDLLRRAEIEVACLQNLLEIKSQEVTQIATTVRSTDFVRIYDSGVQTLTARQHEQLWREQAADLQVSLENQRVDLQDITSNMQRQYKVLGHDVMVAFIV